MKKLHVSFVGAMVAFLTTGAFAAPDFSMIGYATVKDDSLAKTTGGAGGTSRTITNLADLQTWAAGREKNTTPEIVTIEWEIYQPIVMSITIKHGANLTIIGAKGEDMKNVGFNFVDYKNVIVQYMTIHEVEYPDDAHYH